MKVRNKEVKCHVTLALFWCDSTPDDQRPWLTLLETDTSIASLRCRVFDIQIEIMAHPCSQDLPRHWSFCSGASSHSSKRSAKGLTDHLRFFAHRVLFVRKGSDATDPFLWSGLSANRMTAEGQHVKHTVLSSGSGMSRITMAATAYGWCHPQTWHLCRRGFWVHSCLSSSEMLSQVNTSMKSFELLCFVLLSPICLKVFLFLCTSVTAKRKHRSAKSVSR